MNEHAEIKELLSIYDRLPPEEQAALNAHVATCAECASELAAWRRMDRALRYLPDPAPRASLREKIPLPSPLSAAREAAGPRMEAPRPPPAPALPTSDQGEPEPAPRSKLPWRRLLLPAGLVALFVVSIWLGLWEDSRPPRTPAKTPAVPTLVKTPRPGQTAQPRRTTVIFACDDVAAVYYDYAKLARAFEKENPDIEVELKSYRDLLGNQNVSYLQTMEEVAAAADAFCVWDVAPLAQVNLLYDLDPLVANDPTFEPEDFYEAVLKGVRYDSRLYAVPSRFQPGLIRYDPAAFEAAGVAVPQPGWTWDDFAAAAKALTRREDGNTQRWGFAEDAPVVFNARFRAALADPAFESAVSVDHPLTSQAVTDLFEWYERLYVDARGAPVPHSLEDPGGGYLPVYVDPRDISAGKMAMWSDLMYQNARRQGKPAPFPTDGRGGGAPVFTSAAWAMAAETLHADEAWRWLSYLSRNPPCDDQLRLPARRSLVEQLPFWQELPADEAQIYRFILGHLAVPDSRAPSDRVQFVYRMLGGMVSSQMTVAELLARGTGASGTPEAVPTNIPALTVAAPRDELNYYRAAAMVYMAATLNTNVQVIARESLSDPTRAEDTTVWQQMRQIAGRADVIVGPGVAALARSGRAEGIVLDLTDRIAALPPGHGFYSNTVESLAWGGRAWAVPDRVFAYMIAFYPGIFDQMGATQPRPGWTWEDFGQAARAVTQPSADKMKWWGFSEGAGGTLPLLLSATGPLVDYGASPPRPLLDGAPVREAARWYAELWRQGYITVPDVRATTLDAAAPRKAAMWVELVDPAMLDELRQSGVSVAPFPVGAESDATTPIEIENAFAISAGSDRPEDAWKFIDFLLRFRAPDGPEGAPAQPGVGLSAEWGDRATLAAYEYALNHAQRATPLRREEYFAREALVVAITRLAMGESDVEKVLRDAQAAASARMGQ
jgi:multiple sugar transport system substrate-binding protein